MKILNYIMLGILLVVSGLLVTFWADSKLQDAQIEQLSTDLTETRQALDGIKAATDRSDRELTRLSGDLRSVSEKGSVVRERVSMLERTNNEIRDLLSTALPDGGCLLDDSCEAATASPERGPDPSL